MNFIVGAKVESSKPYLPTWWNNIIHIDSSCQSARFPYGAFHSLFGILVLTQLPPFDI